MDEMTLLHEFRTAVAPPASEALQTARAAMLADAAPRPSARRRRVRHRRLALLGTLAAAGAAAAIAVPALLPNGAGTPQAWAVDRNSNGTITVTVSHAFRDPSGLQQALNDAGVRAVVKLWVFTTSGSVTCHQVLSRVAPGAVQSAAVRVVIPKSPDKVPVPGHPGMTMPAWGSWIITPSAIPSGDILYIAGLVTPNVVTFQAGEILTAAGPVPACTSVPVSRPSA